MMEGAETAEQKDLVAEIPAIVVLEKEMAVETSGVTPAIQLCLTLFATSAIKPARCLSNQVAVSRFIAVIVLEVVALEKIAASMTVLTAVIVSAIKKCLTPFATNAAKLVKYLFNPAPANRFIAVIALVKMTIDVMVGVKAEIHIRHNLIC